MATVIIAAQRAKAIAALMGKFSMTIPQRPKKHERVVGPGGAPKPIAKVKKPRKPKMIIHEITKTTV